MSNYKKYGLNKSEYDNLIKFSNNTCYICGAKPKKRSLCIDHNHKTNKVRGLLCFVCNRLLISRLGDRQNAVELFLKASEYLKKYN